MLRRGFMLADNDRVLVIEDVLTTGGSTRETIQVARAAGAQVVGAASIVDRSGGRRSLRRAARVAAGHVAADLRTGRVSALRAGHRRGQTRVEARGGLRHKVLTKAVLSGRAQVFRLHEISMPTFKITLAYDGTNYVGWQRQAAGTSVQGVIEDALRELDGREVVLHGAGRTDAGVHALGQVASCALDRAIDPGVLMRALNARLPADVRVVSAEAVAPDFHARFAPRRRPTAIASTTPTS